MSLVFTQENRVHPTNCLPWSWFQKTVEDVCLLAREKKNTICGIVTLANRLLLTPWCTINVKLSKTVQFFPPTREKERKEKVFPLRVLTVILIELSQGSCVDLCPEMKGLSCSCSPSRLSTVWCRRFRWRLAVTLAVTPAVALVKLSGKPFISWRTTQGGATLKKNLFVSVCHLLSRPPTHQLTHPGVHGWSVLLSSVSCMIYLSNYPISPSNNLCSADNLALKYWCRFLADGILHGCKTAIHFLWCQPVHKLIKL